MSLATNAGIVFGEGEEVLVELEASLSDSGKGLKLVKNALSLDTTIVVTNKRIMAISGAATKKKCCCFGGAKKRSVRYFVPSQITEVGYKMESAKSCCCGKNSFSIYLKTSGCNSVDISLRNMSEKSVQDVIKVIYEVINGNSVVK